VLDFRHVFLQTRTDARGLQRPQPRAPAGAARLADPDL